VVVVVVVVAVVAFHLGRCLDPDWGLDHEADLGADHEAGHAIALVAHELDLEAGRVVDPVVDPVVDFVVDLVADHAAARFADPGSEPAHAVGCFADRELAHDLEVVLDLGTGLGPDFVAELGLAAVACWYVELVHCLSLGMD
jgi:hypothetical protein